MRQKVVKKLLILCALLVAAAGIPAFFQWVMRVREELTNGRRAIMILEKLRDEATHHAIEA